MVCDALGQDVSGARRLTLHGFREWFTFCFIVSDLGRRALNPGSSKSTARCSVFLATLAVSLNIKMASIGRRSLADAQDHSEVGCHICNFYQDLKYRPDAQRGGSQIPMQPQSYGPYAHAQSGAPVQSGLQGPGPYGGGQMPGYK